MFLIFSFFAIAAPAINRDERPVKLLLSMPAKSVKSGKDLDIRIKILTTDPNTSIPFPACLPYEFDQYASESKADLHFELEKMSGGSFKKEIRTEVADHNLPCYDSLGHEMFDTLSVRHPLIRVKNITGYYSFTKGAYRTRVKLNIPGPGTKRKTTIYSEWLYFKTASAIPYER